MPTKFVLFPGKQNCKEQFSRLATRLESSMERESFVIVEGYKETDPEHLTLRAVGDDGTQKEYEGYHDIRRAINDTDARYRNVREILTLQPSAS